VKGILCACLLAALQSSSTARAYEADIHYSATYVLARAVGWPPAEALTIASADQGMDENQHTVAALEMDAARDPSFAGYLTGSLHQADKNLRFHCFSRTGGPTDRIRADVVEVISARFAAVPGHVDDRRKNSTRLIALGTALHCQQDAYSHVDFGGTCGPHSGSCYGHTHQTMLDQVAFGLLNKHLFNPDHPGVSGHWLLKALERTVMELAARRPKASSRSVPTEALATLFDALRRSGLDLPDEVRRDCNRHIAGKWLFELFQSMGRTPHRADRREILAPDIAGTCRNASLASAIAVSIPDPRFPRLNPDASPHLVRADGTYQLVRDGDIDVSLTVMAADIDTRKVKVQLTHWSQLLALALMPRVRPDRDVCARSDAMPASSLVASHAPFRTELVPRRPNRPRTLEAQLRTCRIAASHTASSHS
jgi:hypothetical protein